jgi:hypothetical protein
MEKKMHNLMPLIVHADRLIAQRTAGNCFVTNEAIVDHLNALTAAYLHPHTPDRIAQRLSAAIDRLASVDETSSASEYTEPAPYGLFLLCELWCI